MTTPPPAPSAARVAVVGAGPAGVYAAQMVAQGLPGAAVDLLEKLPVPYGLVRYGVAPDHPRIRGIVDSLHELLHGSPVRVLCDVEVGADVTVPELLDRYDAVVLATGADRAAPLPVPGHDLPGSHGAADFVAWYCSHPDAPAAWPLDAREVAVVGAGNVALDLTRMLVKRADDLLTTDTPDHVHAAFAGSALRTVHLFARRGPADTRFSPLELRELGEQQGVDVLVDPAEVALDEHGRRMVAQFSPKRQVVETLTRWAERDPETLTAPRRVHLHFYRAPARIEGDRRVEALVTERTVPDPLGRVTGTGEHETWPVQAVYRAVGYLSSPVPGAPFDPVRGVVPNDEGRVRAADGGPVPGLYVTGWAKRGPAGLIGSTRSDARQTVDHLLADVAHRVAARAATGATQAPGVDDLLAGRGGRHVSWDGWLRVDAAEVAAGAARGRERVKIATRAALLAAARG
ncbi:FAD-dependent oxidoreductase [Cellulomonas sp. Y8]|uniref:FAD-dependent oxidoreductase n=1 Tax=Cellulomonas sp. Y8 TaxID=2591145 RepID=UPI0011C8DC59|nr:FAD-dependent oxidoreductase [Cellulomonas sp. Y8]